MSVTNHSAFKSISFLERKAECLGSVQYDDDDGDDERM